MATTAKSAAHRVVIVGLGQIGSRFDEEPGRRSVWSHAGAYLAAVDEFTIVGACDPDAECRARFARRCPDTPLFASLDDMMATVKFEVASICTPASSHPIVMQRLLSAPSVRLIWCEKPLADEFAAAQKMVETAQAQGVRLVVSHVRRWTPLWRKAREAITAGRLGTVRCVRVAMPNRLWSMGSHAVDLLHFLGGRLTSLQYLPVPALDELGEPAVAGLVGFEDGAYGVFQVTGRRDRLVVEAEVIGDDARMDVNEATGELRIERFLPSPHYEGYMQLAEPSIEQHATLTTVSPFVEIVREIASLLANPSQVPTCGGTEALRVQELLSGLAIAAPARPAAPGAPA